MRTLIFIPIIALLIFLAGCATSQSDTVKIGWIGPLTGTGSPYGVLELNSAKLAVEDINSAGGINGKPIELIVEDAKCDPATTTTAATKLIEVDGVRYISGGHCSTESMTLVPVTEPKKVLVLAGATAAAGFTGKGKYAFRTYPSATDMYAELAEYAYNKKGTRTVVTLAEQRDGPISIVESFAKHFEKIGGKVLGKETFAPGTTDFKTQLLKIKALNAEAVMISLQGTDTAAQIIKQMQELDIQLQIYSDALVVSKGTYERSNGLLPSTALGASGHVNPEKSPKTKTFLENYKQKFGEIAVDPFFATEGYDQIKIIAELIKSCNDDTDCAREKLISQNWEGASGSFKFNDKGDPTPFFGVSRIEKGKQIYDYES